MNFTRLSDLTLCKLKSSGVSHLCYSAAMPNDRTDADERAARIGLLLDGLHLTAEELTELGKQAVHRARKTIEQSRAEMARARARAAGKDP